MSDAIELMAARELFNRLQAALQIIRMRDREITRLQMELDVMKADQRKWY